MEEGCMFVFYNEIKQGDWGIIENVPSGWDFVGSGMTSPIGSKLLEYRREQQYNGPDTSRGEMEMCLNKYFSDVVEKGLIEKYKICDSFSP